MSNNQLALKGQACILAARNAYDLICKQQDMEKAVECLSALQEDAKQLQRIAEENKEKSAAKEQDLEEEIVRLTKEKDSYDLTISRLNNEKRNGELRLSQQQRELSNAESDLRDAKITLSDAESELHRAKEEDRGLANTITIASIFGLAGAAAGAGIAALISDTKGKCERAEVQVRRRRNDVVSAESAVRYTNQTLSDIQCKIIDYSGRISTNTSCMTEVHDKITANKLTLAVHMQACELWELFVKASEDAAEITQLLEKIIQKAKDKQDLRIIRSNGVIVIAKSVVEAWEEISFNQGTIST